MKNLNQFLSGIFFTIVFQIAPTTWAQNTPTKTLTKSEFIQEFRNYPYEIINTGAQSRSEARRWFAAFDQVTDKELVTLKAHLDFFNVATYSEKSCSFTETITATYIARVEGYDYVLEEEVYRDDPTARCWSTPWAGKTVYTISGHAVKDNQAPNRSLFLNIESTIWWLFGNKTFYSVDEKDIKIENVGGSIYNITTLPVFMNTETKTIDCVAKQVQSLNLRTGEGEEKQTWQSAIDFAAKDFAQPYFSVNEVQKYQRKVSVKSLDLSRVELIKRYEPITQIEDINDSQIERVDYSLGTDNFKILYDKIQAAINP